MMSGDDPIRIRNTIEPGDIGAITRLHGLLYAREYGWDFTFEAYVADGLAKFALNYDGGRDRLWVAESCGAIVGSIAMAHATEGVAQLRWFLIDPRMRGRGLGRRLIDGAMSFARDARYEWVYLWTVRGLEAAARLYRGAGFTVCEATTRVLWGKEVTEERYEARL